MLHDLDGSWFLGCSFKKLSISCGYFGSFDDVFEDELGKVGSLMRVVAEELGGVLLESCEGFTAVIEAPIDQEVDDGVDVAWDLVTVEWLRVWMRRLQKRLLFMLLVSLFSLVHDLLGDRPSFGKNGYELLNQRPKLRKLDGLSRLTEVLG